MAPFVTDLIKGILAFFLLDMGLLVARQLRQVRDVGPFLIGFGLAAPLVGATLALALSVLLGFGVCDATLLAVLASSGSYIVVPAVLRYAIPEARPSRYFTMSLAVTFPFNIIFVVRPDSSTSDTDTRGLAEASTKESHPGAAHCAHSERGRGAMGRLGVVPS